MKEHLCPSCEQGKSKRASHPPKPVANSKQRLHLLHMDLCGPIFGITHETSAAKTPQQNGVVGRKNRMLVEAARTMLIFSHAPLFLWAEVDKPKLIAVTPCPKKLHASIPLCSVPQPREFNVVKHSNVITPGMFKIDPSQTSRVDLVPNNQWLVHIARTRRPHHKCNTRNDRVPSASKSSEAKKNVIVEDHRRNLSLSKNQKTMSSERNNIKLAIRNDKSEIICGCPNLSVVRRLGMFQAYDQEHQASHQLYVKVFGNCSLWERPHCCNSGIWRNTCFIRDLDGVDLLKGNRSTNLYTINLYDMAS
nr:ribonuclease H-like domain-containing protein [Tanacetum cinerariifolium]